jgi:hypothetical protein
MTSVTKWSAFVLGAFLSVPVGCARPTPVTAPAPTALEVPVVPPRVVSALPEEQPPEEAPPLPPEKPRPRPARSRPRPPAVPAEATGPAQKPEPAQEPAPGAAKPAPADQAPVLTTPQTADEPEAARRVRAALGRATDQLGRVNAAVLSSDARAQYETARRFVDQAEGALRARNYMFASYLADKAETLARGLGGR